MSEQPASPDPAAQSVPPEQAPETPAPAEPAAKLDSGSGLLRPEDVTSKGLPVSMRGYDRERVDRLLARIAEGYAQTSQQGQALRVRLRSLEEELEAAKGEARASAKAVAELVQRAATAEDQLAHVEQARDDLQARFDRSESERQQATSELREATERASALGKRVESLEGAQRGRWHDEAAVPAPSAADGEATLLLVAAARAAEDVRVASRDRALRTLLQARARETRLRAEVAREQAALAELNERREVAERESAEILAAAQSEAARASSAIEDERRRVRELLTGALSALDTAVAPHSSDLVDDLSSRLHEAGDPAVAEPPVAGDGQHQPG